MNRFERQANETESMAGAVAFRCRLLRATLKEIQHCANNGLDLDEVIISAERLVAEINEIMERLP